MGASTTGTGTPGRGVPPGDRPVRVLRRLLARLVGRRRLRFTRGGGYFTAGALAVGLAAVNTGNNLLYLLLGAMLGFITLSGWLSELTLRRLSVRRRAPLGVSVERPVRISYEVANLKRRLASFAVRISESGLQEVAFVPSVPPGSSATGRAEVRFIQRGVYPLSTVTLSTSFPFGLFRKERDLELPGELVIWPRTTRRVRSDASGGERQERAGSNRAGAPGARGEYRGLRGYRPGDDPKDIHWRSSARLQAPVVREYDRDSARGVWICLDTRHPPGPRAEWAVEAAASLASSALRERRRVGLLAGAHVVPPGTGTGQLERILDALARVDFSPGAAPPAPPSTGEGAVLVSVGGRGGDGFTDVVTPEADWEAT